MSAPTSPIRSAILTGGPWARGCQDSRLRGERRPKARLPRRFWGGGPSHVLPSLLRGATEGRKVGGGPHGGLTTAPFLKEGRPNLYPEKNQPLLCPFFLPHCCPPPCQLVTCFAILQSPQLPKKEGLFSLSGPALGPRIFPVSCPYGQGSGCSWLLFNCPVCQVFYCSHVQVLMIFGGVEMWQGLEPAWISATCHTHLSSFPSRSLEEGPIVYLVLQDRAWWFLNPPRGKQSNVFKHDCG